MSSTDRVDITDQVTDELELVERMHYGQVEQGSKAVWNCSNGDCEVDDYRPVLVPGEEEDYPRCPGCHESPAVSDVVPSETVEYEVDDDSMREKWSDIFDKNRGSD